MKRFAEKVDALLSASGLSQADLARACGVSQPSVNAWLKQGGLPRPENFLNIARTLGVTVDFLIDDEQDEPVWLAEGEKCRQVMDVIRTVGVSEAWRRLVQKPEVQWDRTHRDEPKPAGGRRVNDHAPEN